MDTTKRAGPVFVLPLAIMVAMLLTQVVYLSSDYIASTLAHWVLTVDPDEVFAVSYVHHVAQLGLALAVMAMPFWRRSLGQWGLNLHSWQWSVRVSAWFCIAWILVIGAGSVLLWNLAGRPPLVSYPITGGNVARSLLSALTIPGISQEVLFRGLVIGTLMRASQDRIRFLGIDLPLAGLLAAVIFAIAQIGGSLHTFGIVFLQPMQILVPFGLGLLYAVMYDRTGSLLGPVLVSNVSGALLGLIYIGLTALGS